MKEDHVGKASTTQAKYWRTETRWNNQVYGILRYIRETECEPGQAFASVSNETLDFIKDTEFSDYLMIITLSRTPTHGMSV
jgi:hypothetical protein